MKTRISKSEKGLALVAVVVFTCIFVILGFSMLNMAKTEIVMTQKELNSARAFYAAEAGIAELSTKLYNNKFEDITDTVLGEANYKVDLDFDVNPPFAVSTGTAGLEVKKIKVELTFLAPPYEHAVYAGNLSGNKWDFSLRGTGNPKVLGMSGKESGGKDIVNGNIFVNGDASLYEESNVNPSPQGNYKGDIDSTGKAKVLDSATVSGTVTEGAPGKAQPDLVDMNYAVNNTHNVSKIFADAGVDSGYLPSDNELYDVMVKNPSNRSSECTTTTGDDYFLEPSSVNNFGAQYKDARTPLDLGENRIYYVDGDLWVHSPSTYGFLVDGQVTIVVTGDIHISDNLKYADSESLLGLVALGEYDGSGQLISGGNIYFGDPRFGTMSTASAFMFAADSFLYNTDAISRDTAEPTSGISIYGNLNALNQVSIQRDWYKPNDAGGTRAAYFDPTRLPDGKWVDLETGNLLSTVEINSISHYQMAITYDDRILNPETQPPGLPRATEGFIFGGLRGWEELPRS
ncbi:MAG: hypothetical protein H8D56_14080 [Planctomycetes bacterium]|nr:hypothetical protein [Planctomycetota bacterium]MBL7145910.1 hypothetical protein [Phycisphaerae bacterium]